MLNSCNSAYYKKILQANGVDITKRESESQILEILQKYEGHLPKSNTHTRLLIDLLPAGPVFESKLISFMKPLLVKGVPSLINDMKIVYKDQQKAAIIGQVLTRWNENMEKELVINQEDQEEQDPTVQLWLYYFLS